MKTNLARWIREQEAACRRTTKGRWRLTSDAQGPCMVMHPRRRGVAIATLTSAHLPANGMHDPSAKKPSPCPEAPGGTTYLPERVANARFIAEAHDSLPVALRLIRAARGASDPDAAMQAALDEVLEERAAQVPPRAARGVGLPLVPAKPAARKRRPAATRRSIAPAANDDDDGEHGDSDRAMFLRQDREQARIELARKKNVGLAEGEPEFAPCGDCGHVHNESSCPRCEGDGEEDCAAGTT